MIDRLCTRDHLVWTLALVGSVLAFTVAHTHLIPPAYTERVKDIATVIGFVAGKVSTSPFPDSSSLEQ